MPFTEPNILWSNDRTYNDKKELVRLEQDEYNDRLTFTLRVCWSPEDDQWRWSQSRPDRNGKYWDAFRVREEELRSLGKALIAAADQFSQRAASGGKPQANRAAPAPARGARRPTAPPPQTRFPVDEPGDDDIPF